MYSYEERLSNFDKARGIIGHECMNELLVKIRFAVLYNNRSILEGLSKIKFWSRILSHTVKELFRAFSYKKSRKPLKTKAFGVVHWRP